MTTTEARAALQEHVRRCREHYSPKMFAKISGGVWPLMEAVLFDKETREDDLRTVRSKLEGVSRAWSARTCIGQGQSACLRVTVSFEEIREAAEACALLDGILNKIETRGPDA